MGGGQSKIYGVKFDGTNSVGTRLLGAKGLQFTPSNTTIAGVDDFITIEDSPFHIRECISDYNTATGKQKIISYEGDSKWDNLVANKIGNRMIEFPKFYYRRPSKWEWYVTSEPRPGFLPSPMHYRNGVMHDYVYVAKYAINSNYNSQTGETILTSTDLTTYRNNLRSYGMYVWDYALLCSLQILMLIKYNNTNFQSIIGKGDQSGGYSTGTADLIKGKDGCASNDITSNAGILCFAIENFYAKCWKTIDGVYRNGNSLYINTDIENITSNSTSGYARIPTGVASPSGWAWITDIVFDSTYPWAIFPTNYTSSPQDYNANPGTMIGDACWGSSSSRNMGWSCFGSTHGNACGPFSVASDNSFGFGYSNIGASSFFLSEQVSVIEPTRIYGVQFDSVNSEGIRLYDSVGKKFSPSSTTVKGDDDFINDNNGNNPFHVRECLTTYNSSTGKQEVVMYEDDPDYASNRANSAYNVMIEFPKFYYKRPSKWEWYVSSEQKTGFNPSPMHYRAGKMHDYVYVAKYHSNSNYKSQPNSVVLTDSTWKTDGSGPTIANFRNNFRSQGMYLWDYAVICSINILMFIKYNCLDVKSVIGAGYRGFYDGNSTKANTGLTDIILSKDGYAGTTKNNNACIVCMGIENYYSNVWKLVDGVLYTKTDPHPFFNTDIESITSTPTISNHPGFMQCNSTIANSNGYIADILFDQEFPWVMLPTQISDNNTMINDIFNTDTSTCGACIMGGSNSGPESGPLTIGCFDNPNQTWVNVGAASFFLSSSYT